VSKEHADKVQYNFSDNALLKKKQSWSVVMHM